MIVGRSVIALAPWRLAAAVAGVALLAGPAPGASAQPSEYEQVLRSPTPGVGQRFGEQVAMIGDVDGDGDIAAGLPGHSPSPDLELSGAVRVYR